MSLSPALLKRWKNEILWLRKAYMDCQVETGIKGLFAVRENEDSTPSEINVFQDLATYPCEFEVMMEGPADSPYAGRDYNFLVVVPADFPMKPPRITCLFPFTDRSRPQHFYAGGGICCYALFRDYSPSYTIVYLLNCIREVMFEPTSKYVESITEQEIEKHEEKQKEKSKSLLLLTNG